MPRRRLVVVLVAGAAVALVAVVVAGVVVGLWLRRDTGPDRGVTASPTASDVASALAFCDLAPLPPGAVAGPLRREQGIDGLVVLRIAAVDPVGDWLAAGGLPAPAPATTTADVEFGPDLPAGTPVVAQHRVQRPGGGIVYRSAVLGPGAVEVRCFET
ncbi:hypothetical protein [Actinomycetospora atypica]|uniref:Uncharacterized protein n=1 Tax=Actinomycetospora atypica TaxID=1290095 RepID=A0ABV9YI11_9PSEU